MSSVLLLIQQLLLKAPIHLRAVLAGLLLFVAGIPIGEELGLSQFAATAIGALCYVLGGIADRAFSRLLIRDRDGNGISDIAELVQRRVGIPAVTVEDWIRRYKFGRPRGE